MHPPTKTPLRRAGVLLAVALLSLLVTAWWSRRPQSAAGRLDDGASDGERPRTPARRALASSQQPARPRDAAPGGDPLAHGTAAARRALQEHADRLQRALESTRPFERHRACLAEGRDDCEELRTTAQFAALARDSMQKESQALGRRLLTEHGLPAVARAAAEQMRSPDEVDRLATLAMLGHNPELAGVELPADAYRDLAGRGVAEMQLIMQRHRGHPLPGASVAREAADLALDPEVEPRIRSAIPIALGHARDGDLLARVVEAWTEDPQPQAEALWLSLPAALRRCGEACDDSRQRLDEALRDSHGPLAPLIAEANQPGGEDETKEVQP